MAIAFASIPSPVEAEAERLEALIDKKLEKMFKTPNPPKVYPYRLWKRGMDAVSDFHREVVARLISRYEEQGWKVKWNDGNEGRLGVVTFYPTLLISPSDRVREAADERLIDDERLWTTWVIS